MTRLETEERHSTEEYNGKCLTRNSDVHTAFIDRALDGHDNHGIHLLDAFEVFSKVLSPYP